MTTTFEPRDFYGGAIKGIIPQGWLDASDLRQVPDHQEIFLSPSTLSNLIIELNELVAPSTLPSLPSTASQEETDAAAALYHLNDLLDVSNGDTLTVLSPPEKVELARLRTSRSGNTIRAYTGAVALTTRERERRSTGPVSIGGAAAGSSVQGALTSTVGCFYLLIRVEETETDLLVFFNVPRKEWEERGDLMGLAREQEGVLGVLGGLVERLEVVDWGLFGEG